MADFERIAVPLGLPIFRIRTMSPLEPMDSSENTACTSQLPQPKPPLKRPAARKKTGAKPNPFITDMAAHRREKNKLAQQALRGRRGNLRIPSSYLARPLILFCKNQLVVLQS